MRRSLLPVLASLLSAFAVLAMPPSLGRQGATTVEAASSQFIIFSGIGTKTFGATPFVISPTATSGLTVSLSASGQ
jgi:hypothetical protein